MAIEIKMSPSEAEATYRVLRAAERKAEAEYRAKPSIENRDKLAVIESARIHVAQKIQG